VIGLCIEKRGVQKKNAIHGDPGGTQF
jgi:hypothetical protein